MTTTLADHLRSLPDDGLTTLLELRPDLVVPVPSDVPALAVRVQSRVSVARALDALDLFTLEILDAVRLSRAPEGTSSVNAVLALTAAVPGGPDPAAVRRAVDRLRALVLVYGPDQAMHVVATVDEVCPPYPAGLGRPAEELDPEVATLCADPARLRRTLLSAPPPARAVLDRLASGPPVGTVAAGALAAVPRSGGSLTGSGNPKDSRDGRDPRDSSGTDANSTPDSSDKTDGGNIPDSPVGWLVAHRLLARTSDCTVELPREVGLLLRRDCGPLGPLHPRPPLLDPPARRPAAVDSAGAGQAMEAVRNAEALLEAVAAEPVPLLRSGGLGVRELRRLARAAGAEEPVAVLLLELAYAAGLFAEAERLDKVGARPNGGPLYLPTSAYDSWRALPLAQRWGVLAQTWLALAREPRLVGERDDRDRPVNVLAPEAERAGAPATRLAALAVLATLPAGAAPSAEEVLAQLAWQSPRRAGGRAASSRAALDEAAVLGVTGLGALTGYSRQLVRQAADPAADGEDPLGVRAPEGDTDGPVAALGALLPPPVNAVVVQADLTVVVPGPPEPALASELAMVAVRESAGGATVYRVTADSVRRALDAGYAASDLHALFARRSRTPVPQALTYLIDDVARRHGGLRTGAAGAYLRSDDEPLLAELLVDRRVSALALRRLAPTVLVTPYSAGRLLATLREAGYAPVPEDATGAAMLTRPKTRRAAARGGRLRPAADPLAAPRLTPPRLLGIVEQIRRGDAAARAARRAPAQVRAANGQAAEGLTAVQAHTQALAVLQQAVRERSLVWVGYVDAHGGTAQRLVRPVSIGAGYLRAEDERTDTLHTFALHRITAAVLDG
ncbi:MAG TPA: helicase-associated domain-containing protein [Micromonosporaceae bacterium]|nr:helicase-associated domain-containing protein [Micromonosporaceae bacterium]